MPLPITLKKVKESTRKPPETPLSWPIELQTIKVISIRPHRYLAFQKRMGPWKEHASLIHGTNGANIIFKKWKHKIGKSTLYRKPGGPPSYMRRGQIGCYDSHWQCWKYQIENNIPYLLVCEDDANIQHNPKTVIRLEECFREIEEYDVKFDILHLGHSFGKVFRRLTPHLFAAKKCQGAFMYLLTLDGAKKLFKHAIPFTFPVDCYMYRVPGIRIVTLHPKLCYVVKVISDTEGIK